VALVEALERVGLQVEPGGTIEGLARRVRERFPTKLGDDCARALLGYAALRYGDRGDVDAIASELDARRLELVASGRGRPR
jgi:hypothetical protein